VLKSAAEAGSYGRKKPANTAVFSPRPLAKVLAAGTLALGVEEGGVEEGGVKEGGGGDGRAVFDSRSL
jgi:hypothetical protein